ncbi:MAG: germination protein YpeB [Bacillota bacterium]|nr:germination protein YpeB [Bacillota bacterium]
MRREWLRFGGVVLVVVLGLMAFREYRLRREIEVRTENQYQRAFQEVVYHVDGLEQELGKASAAGSATQTAKAFADAWRHAESARSAIGQLPVGNVPLATTEDFIGQVAAFTYTLAQKGASGATVSEREWTILRDFRRQAKFAADELAGMGRAFAAGALRWTDFQRDTVAAAATRPDRTPARVPSNQVTKGFKMLEDGMTRFPSPDLEGVLPPPTKKLPQVPGPVVTADEAARVALDFVGPSVAAGRRARVVGRIRSDPEAYRIEIPAGGGRGTVWVDVSVKGGRVLWVMDETPIGPVTVSPAAAEQIAADFLASRGFANMRRISRQSYQGVAVIGFAYEQEGILVYPDHVVVRVALDTGRVDGFEGTNYQVFHRPRQYAPPAVTEDEARAAVNPRLDVTASRLAVIMDDFYRETLVYEFRGTVDGQRYLVYVNTNTGEEEKIKRVGPQGIETI